MNKYVDLIISAIASALAAGGGVATTTKEVWPIAVAALIAFGVSITQHMRQLPRDEWTEEERQSKEIK